MDKKIGIIACIIVIIALIVGVAAYSGVFDGESKVVNDDKTLVVGFDAEFPPYGYKDDNWEYVGFDLDVAQEVCDRNNWTLVKQPIDWDAKDSELNSGSIDCIWNGFTMNGREDQYTWSDPYFDNKQVIVVKNGSGIDSLSDLKGKNVETQKDSSALAALQGDQKALADTLGRHGADEVLVAESKLLEHYTTDGYTKVICDLANDKKPGIIFIGATFIGRDLGPRVAARLSTGLTADCTALDIDDETGNMAWTRPAFGGNLMATIMCPDHRPQLGTVRPGVFKKSEPGEVKDIPVIKEKVEITDAEKRVELLEVINEMAGELVDLENAEIIVSGGRGVGGPEGFAPVRELAEVLGATVGASRAAVDAGWIPHAHQVGQTGKTVGPKIYIACGISGAIQHLAGMSSSDVIIAINKDPDAPIFNVADYGLVGDLKVVLPILTEKIRKYKGL